MAVSHGDSRTMASEESSMRKSSDLFSGYSCNPFSQLYTQCPSSKPIRTSIPRARARPQLGRLGKIRGASSPAAYLRKSCYLGAVSSEKLLRIRFEAADTSAGTADGKWTMHLLFADGLTSEGTAGTDTRASYSNRLFGATQ
jgi:hypothetical protein